MDNVEIAAPPQQEISPELKQLLQTMEIDSESQKAIDAFLAKYSDMPRIGYLRGYAYHGASEHPTDALNAKQACDYLVDKLKAKLSTPNPNDAENRRHFFENTLEFTNNYSTKDGVISFGNWSMGFPDVRNNVHNIITKREIYDELTKVLDKLTLTRVRELFNPLLENARNLSDIFSLFNHYPNQEFYGKPTKTFTGLDDQTMKFFQRVNSMKHYYKINPVELEQRKSEHHALTNTIIDAFSQAPEAVQQNVIKLWDKHSEDFLKWANVTVLPSEIKASTDKSRDLGDSLRPILTHLSETESKTSSDKRRSLADSLRPILTRLSEIELRFSGKPKDKRD